LGQLPVLPVRISPQRLDPQFRGFGWEIASFPGFVKKLAKKFKLLPVSERFMTL